MRFTLALVATMLIGCGDDGGTGLEEVEIEVVGPAGNARLVVLAEVARTAAARAQGLEGRTALSGYEGLLLLFPAETEACVTNRAVAFPIDAIFFGGKGEVVGVERSLAAGETEVACHQGTASILEVAASVAGSVRIGDQQVLR